MAVHKTAGAKFYIGPEIDSDAINAGDDAAAITAFEAIEESEWTEIEEIEDLGEHGDVAEEITFTAVGNRRVRKFKGAKNAGTKTIVCGRDPLDAGQDALLDAEGTDFNYAFKVVHADARGEDYSDSVEYFGGIVMSKQVQQGAVNTITRRSFAIGVNTACFEVESEQTS
jgi:hypothetical protein